MICPASTTFRQADILLGGRNIAGGVIMHKDTQDIIIQIHSHLWFVLTTKEART
jgi:succinyl-CoA synthetase beta subunit